MLDLLKKLPVFVEAIRAMMDTIITNIVLIGQIPAPTFHEKERADLFLERLAEFQVDECTTDGFHNPIGVIRGTNRSRPPIFLVAHMDTAFGPEVDHHYTIKRDAITGAGLLDNALGIAVLLSFPEIVRRLELRFESDIVLAGVIQSIGKGNLRGIRHLLKTWPTPVRGAICMESSELGRLNYYSDGMIRGEITCQVDPTQERSRHFLPNAILVINEVINQIMELRLPLKPRSKIVFGTIQGGFKHGQIAHDATLGFEIRSDADQMVKTIYSDIKDIVSGIRHEYEVELVMETVSNLRAARLKYNHPLVKSTVAIMERLGLEPFSEPSESELSIFLARNIPAVTLGITHGEGYQQPDATMQIEPMFTGIAQILATVMAIDSGVCDG
jgi:tripeptide aminopeptidase